MKNQVMSLMIFLLSISSSNSLFSALKVVPGGQNIAFEVYPSGIIVTGSYNVKTSKNTYNPSKDSDINKGDWFKSTDVNGKYHVGTKIDPLYCHKATVSEIIEQ